MSERLTPYLLKDNRFVPYKSVAKLFCMALLAVIFLCCTSMSFASTSLQLSNCPKDTITLEKYLQVFQDVAAEKTITDIQQLTDISWSSVQNAALTNRVSRSAYWYRMSIDNQASLPCQLWLALATERINDVQVYIQQPNSDWMQLRAGTAYPFNEWANHQRIPSLPIMLAEHNRTTIFLRFSSREGFRELPQLLSQQALIKERMADSVLDGMLAGVIVSLIVFSLLVGYFFRLNVAIVHAFSISAYALYVAVAQGYAFIYLWPQALDWNTQALLVMETIMRIVALGCVRVLLQVKEQPPIIRTLMTCAQLSLVFLLVLRLLSPEVDWLAYGGLLSTTLTVFIILIIAAAVFTGMRRKLDCSWFGYGLALLFVAQNTLLVLFFIDVVDLSPTQYSRLVISALPSALLLGYTLVSQVRLVLQREQRVMTDIEQLKRAEQESLELRVESRTQQLRDALSNQNLLLARISHDLRSPLQHVIRDARLLQTASGRAEFYGRSIQRAAQQQLEMIDELLEFSKGELKQLELLIAPGYLFGFLREIEESGAFLAERNNNTFKKIFADDLPLLVNADFRRLRQVIINLLVNAAKFTQQGEIVFSVKLISNDKQAGYVDLQFMVSDNGIGIPQAERENLLQPFVRGENSTRYEGVGLGLFIVRQLLDSMHSELLIESTELAGVQCSFTLHLELAAEQELEQVFVESYAASEEGRQRTVLIVDDVAITRELLYELLSGYDYNPLTCSSAAEALIMLREHPVDIIVTDQVMPGMDGWDLLRNVRKEWPQLPIMLYSARPPVRPLDLETAVDFDACLLKPAATVELLTQISQLLR